MIPEDIFQDGFIHNGGFHKYITRLLTIISQNKETVYHHLRLRTNRYVSEKLFDQMNELWSAHHMNEGLKFSAEYVQIATVGMTRSLLPLFGMTELSASRKKRTPRAGEFFFLHHRPFRLIASTTRSVCSRTLVSDMRFEIIA